LLKTASVYLAIVLGTIVGAEAAARLWTWTPPAWDAAPTDGIGSLRYYHSPTGLGDLVPDQNGLWMIWSHRPYHVQTNSVGLRNTEEPAADAFKILAVGDSQTFGPYLANEDTWPAWSETFLRQRNGQKRKIQVFNAGVSGYTILDEYNYLREKGVHLKPDLVIIGVFENDISDFAKERNGMVQRPVNGVQSRGLVQLKALVRSSALFSLAQSLKTRAQLASAGVDVARGEATVGRDSANAPPPAYKARYSEFFRQTVTLLKTNSIRLAVIFIPDAETAEGSAVSDMEPVIRELTQETGTPYLDLTPALRAQADPAERLYLLQRIDGRLTGNGHLSRAGTAVVARAVVDWLLSTKLAAP